MEEAIGAQRRQRALVLGVGLPWRRPELELLATAVPAIRRGGSGFLGLDQTCSIECNPSYFSPLVFTAGFVEAPSVGSESLDEEQNGTAPGAEDEHHLLTLDMQGRVGTAVLENLDVELAVFLLGRNSLANLRDTAKFSQLVERLAARAFGPSTSEGGAAAGSERDPADGLLVVLNLVFDLHWICEHPQELAQNIDLLLFSAQNQRQFDIRPAIVLTGLEWELSVASEPIGSILNSAQRHHEVVKDVLELVPELGRILARYEARRMAASGARRPMPEMAVTLAVPCGTYGKGECLNFSAAAVRSRWPQQFGDGVSLHVARGITPRFSADAVIAALTGEFTPFQIRSSWFTSQPHAAPEPPQPALEAGRRPRQQRWLTRLLGWLARPGQAA